VAIKSGERKQIDVAPDVATHNIRNKSCSCVGDERERGTRGLIFANLRMAERKKPRTSHVQMVHLIPLLVTGYVMGCGEIRHANSNSLIIDRHKSTILVEMSF
jgi:hypothetical protein